MKKRMTIQEKEKERDRREYQRLVSDKLDCFLTDYNKDIYEFAYLCRVNYKVIENVYFREGKTNLLTLTHISSCIDAIRFGRYDRHTWEILH